MTRGVRKVQLPGDDLANRCGAGSHLDAFPLPGGAHQRDLTTDAGDAVTGTGEYKVCAADVKKLEDAPPGHLFPGSYYAAEGPGPGPKRVPTKFQES